MINYLNVRSGPIIMISQPIKSSDFLVLGFWGISVSCASLQVQTPFQTIFKCCALSRRNVYMPAVCYLHNNNQKEQAMHATCSPFAYCTFMPLKREKMNNLRRLGPKKTIYTVIEIKRSNQTCGGWGALLVSHVSKKKKNKDKFMCSTHLPIAPDLCGIP